MSITSTLWTSLLDVDSLLFKAVSRRLNDPFANEFQGYDNNCNKVATAVYKLARIHDGAFDEGRTIIGALCEDTGTGLALYYYDQLTGRLRRFRNGAMSTSQINHYIRKFQNSPDWDDFLESLIEDDFSYCDDCGDWEANDSMTTPYSSSNSICRDCISDSYTFLDSYDAYFHSDEIADALDEDGDSVTIYRDDEDYRWDDDEDTYVHVNYRSDRVIGNYHSSKRRCYPIPSDWSRRNNRYLGVELEVEVNKGDREDAAIAINDAVNDGNVGHRLSFENDGSLSNGFEMVSQPMGLDMHTEVWKWLKSPDLTRPLLSHKTSTCGLHVHVSKKGLTKLQIAKIVTFVNAPSNQDLIEAIARRYGQRFCAVHQKKLGSAYKRNGDRYVAVNLEPRDTIEFRIFRGTLKYESLMAALEFTNALVNFCNETSGFGFNLSTPAFMSFIKQHKVKSETRFLRAYLEQRLEAEQMVA